MTRNERDVENINYLFTLEWAFYLIKQVRQSLEELIQSSWQKAPQFLQAIMAFILQATELTPFWTMLGGFGRRGTPYDLSMMLLPLLGFGFSLMCWVVGLTGRGGGAGATTASFTASSAVSAALLFSSPALSWVSTLAGLVGRMSVCLSAGVGGALDARGGGGSPATREEAGMAISLPSAVWTRTNLPVILVGPLGVVFPPPSAS